MSWSVYPIEDAHRSKSYVPVLRRLIVGFLSQLTLDDARGFLKRTVTGVVWAVESNDSGGYDQDKKRPRSTYILRMFRRGPVGVRTSSINKPDTHVEHPYTQKETRRLLERGYVDAHAAMDDGRLTFEQCVWALMAIVDARRHTVLMPKQFQRLFSQSATPGDGFVNRYAGCDVEFRAGGVVNFQQEDDRVKAEVENALQYLQVSQGDAIWPWHNSLTCSVNTARTGQYGYKAGSKNSNAATLLEVTNAHVQAVIDELGLTARQSPKDMDNGWSLYGRHGVVFSGLKADVNCSVATMGLTNPAIGGIKTPQGIMRISQLKIDEFEKYVQLHR